MAYPIIVAAGTREIPILLRVPIRPLEDVSFEGKADVYMVLSENEDHPPGTLLIRSTLTSEYIVHLPGPLIRN